MYEYRLEGNTDHASAVKVGGFLTQVEAAVPPGTIRLRFRATSEAGVMLDEVELAEERPMQLVAVTAHQPVVPVLVHDTADTLAARVLTQEHLIYPQAVAQFLAQSPTRVKRG